MASIVCVLLRTPSKRLGVLHLDRGFIDDPFTPLDLRYADAIAAGVSVHQVRMDRRPCRALIRDVARGDSVVLADLRHADVQRRGAIVIEKALIEAGFASDQGGKCDCESESLHACTGSGACSASFSGWGRSFLNLHSALGH